MNDASLGVTTDNTHIPPFYTKILRWYFSDLGKIIHTLGLTSFRAFVTAPKRCPDYRASAAGKRHLATSTNTFCNTSQASAQHHFLRCTT